MLHKDARHIRYYPLKNLGGPRLNINILKICYFVPLRKRKDATHAFIIPIFDEYYVLQIALENIFHVLYAAICLSHKKGYIRKLLRARAHLSPS